MFSARITLGKGSWPQFFLKFDFNHSFFCFSLPISLFQRQMGKGRGWEEITRLQGRTEGQREKKGNKTEAQNIGSFEGFQGPFSGREKRHFSCDSEIFYIAKRLRWKMLTREKEMPCGDFFPLLRSTKEPVGEDGDAVPQRAASLLPPPRSSLGRGSSSPSHPRLPLYLLGGFAPKLVSLWGWRTERFWANTDDGEIIFNGYWMLFGFPLCRAVSGWQPGGGPGGHRVSCSPVNMLFSWAGGVWSVFISAEGPFCTAGRWVGVNGPSPLLRPLRCLLWSCQGGRGQHAEPH